MRWPWTRRERRAPCPPVSDDSQEAAQARIQAEAALMQAKQRSGEVRQVASQSRQHRRVNHFAELIAETFKGAR